ncbi:FK506-binding protein 14 [Pelomyxa schiedti]|nr:FK506-binding protein 14 [Pelomyxa schiedti]
MKKGCIVLLLFVVAAYAAQELKVTVMTSPESCLRKSKNGDTLKMHYTGTLAANGEKFDSSVDRGQPFQFVLGTGRVIKGWDQGLVGMCVGEKRLLEIPPELGYGSRGAGRKIPPNAALNFEVELLEIVNKEEL